MKFVIIETFARSGIKSKTLVNLSNINFIGEFKNFDSVIEECTVIDFDCDQLRTKLSIDEILKLASEL